MASRENLPGIKFTPSDTQYLDSRGFVVVRSEADRETPSQSNLPLSPKWLSAFWPDSRSRASFFDRGLFLGSWAFQQVLRAVKFRLFRVIRERRRQSQPILEKLQSQIGGCLATRIRRGSIARLSSGGRAEDRPPRIGKGLCRRLRSLSSNPWCDSRAR